MTIRYKNVYINETSTITGPYEQKGPLNNYFDKSYDDLYFKQPTWEQAESKLIEESVDLLLLKIGKTRFDIDLFISGDLLNQITASNYAASRLGIPFLDRQIISEAARTSGLPEDVIRKTENQKPFTNAFYEMFSYYATTNNQSVSEQVFLAESKVITDAADKGSCVIVGRCANYVLKGRKSCLSVFIHAPKNDRIRRAHDVYGIKSQNLEAYVMRQDKSRASYYNYFAENKWSDCKSYDLCLNSTIGLDACVEVIKAAALNLSRG